MGVQFMVRVILRVKSTIDCSPTSLRFVGALRALSAAAVHVGRPDSVREGRKDLSLRLNRMSLRGGRNRMGQELQMVSTMLCAHMQQAVSREAWSFACCAVKAFLFSPS